MSSRISRDVIIRFGPFEANLSTQELQKFGIRLRVPNQSFQILALLLEHPGQLVTRDELQQKLWPSDTFVEYDQGLNAAVNRLRDALGDSADKPRYIETLPRRGYRFLASAQIISENHPEVGATSNPGSSQPATATLTEQPSPAVPVDFSNSSARILAGRARWKRLPQFTAMLAILCLLVVAATPLWVRRRPHEPNFSSVRVVPFTSLPGQEVAPTFSPDGSQIAFSWSRNLETGLDLYVKTMGSERILKLTNHPAKWISPAWSPDGTEIAFSRWSKDDSGIFIIPALGGPERKLADAKFWYEPFMQISWSADSKSLVFPSTEQGSSHIFLLRLENLQPRVLYPDMQCWDMAAPAFSPDGKHLAFVCTSSIAVYDLYEAPIAGGTPHRLTSMMGYFRGLTWSADGTRVIYSNDSGDGGSLWQVSLDGNLAKLPFGEQGSNPSSATRSNRLAYVRGWKTVDIWRVDLASQHPEASATKLIYSTRIQRVPQYSPDGSKIVFESDRSGTHEIWMADADGSNLVQLTSFNGPQTGGPSWCSDGQRIAFDSRVSGISAIYIEDINERVSEQIKANVRNLAMPSWSQDCQWLLASDGHENLYRVSTQGGPATRISDKGSWFSVVQAGKLFFNVKEANRISIWSKSIDGAAEEPLERMPHLDAAESWTATSRGIYYTVSTASPASINFYDFSTRKARRLFTLPQSPMSGGGMSVSPDGRWLLYAQTDDAQSDLMLAEHFR
jgi:Tol biopolymer transport system component/DNA-binding winged helix-turn-helix (wHTH) protein